MDLNFCFLNQFINNQMKAILFRRNGNPEDVLEYADIPIPVPKEKEVLVRILASPVNPADNMFIEGRYRVKPEFPQVAGLEATGIIEGIGPGVDLVPGSLVSFRHRNTWAEYAIVPAEKLCILPALFPIEKAAQFSLNPFTAWALLEQAMLTDMDYLLLTAGNSSVSKIMLQLANRRGIKTIAVVRSLIIAEELKSLGATYVLEADPANLAAQVSEVTDGKGVNAIVDAVGGAIGTELIHCAAAKGQILLYGLLSEDHVSFYNAEVIMKLLTLKGFGLDNWLQSTPELTKQKMMQELISTIGSADFKMPVAGKFSLSDFQSALKCNQQFHHSGKVLLYPG
jgi:NADPH:quinone reductase